MNEIKFIDEPSKFKDVSCKVKTLLLTNNAANANFAEKVELDYKYSESIEIDAEGISRLFFEKDYDLLIFDVSVQKDVKVQDSIAQLSQVFGDLNKSLDKVAFSFAFSPIRINPSDVSVDSRLNSTLPNKENFDKIRSIIPV